MALHCIHFVRHGWMLQMAEMFMLQYCSKYCKKLWQNIHSCLPDVKIPIGTDKPFMDCLLIDKLVADEPDALQRNSHSSANVDNL